MFKRVVLVLACLWMASCAFISFDPNEFNNSATVAIPRNPDGSVRVHLSGISRVMPDHTNSAWNGQPPGKSWYFHEPVDVFYLKPGKYVVGANGCTPGSNQLGDEELAWLVLDGNKTTLLQAEPNHSYEVTCGSIDSESKLLVNNITSHSKSSLRLPGRLAGAP